MLEFDKESKLHSKESQSLWNSAKQSKVLSKDELSREYRKFNDQVKIRNELAYNLASFGGREKIYDRSGSEIEVNIYNHTSKSEWSSILRHSNMYIKCKLQDGKNLNINTIKNSRQQVDMKQKWQDQHIMIKEAVKDRSEEIAISLLGSPNKKLSTKSDLRFGDNGNLLVNISGFKSGTWYDFTNSFGGDMFDLVRNQSGCNFKEAANYLRQQVGMGYENLYSGSSYNNSSNSKYKTNEFESINNSISDAKYHKQQNDKERALAEEKKQEKVTKLYARSVAIEESSVASKYLKDHRFIDCKVESDIRQANIYINGQNYYLPALVAFSRDKAGEITGYQQILLDRKTSNKANIPVPKRSFGRIAGSFVEISKAGEKSEASGITIIAEGVETALSIKEAGIDAKILCSLGVNNIGNYIPDKGEKIIIAGDNDGKDAASDNPNYV